MASTTTYTAAACDAVMIPIWTDVNGVVTQTVTNRDWAILCAERGTTKFDSSGNPPVADVCAPKWDMSQSTIPAASCEAKLRTSVCGRANDGTLGDGTLTDRCEALNAIVWSSTTSFGGGSAGAEPGQPGLAAPRCRVNADNPPACAVFVPPAETCGALLLPSAPPTDFDPITECANAPVSADGYTCVYGGMDVLAEVPYCIEIPKEIATDCSADHLNRYENNCAFQGSAIMDISDIMEGSPLCTFELADYPASVMDDSNGTGWEGFEPYPCYKSNCNAKVNPSTTGYASFSDYLAFCQGADMTDTTNGHCLPRITGHDFTIGPSPDASCVVVQSAVDCSHFLSEETCRIATLSILSGTAVSGPVYPVCEWDADKFVCNVAAPGYADTCSLSDASAEIFTTDAETVNFCALAGSNCIPRGGATYFQSPTESSTTGVNQYCIQLSQEELTDLDFFCGTSMMNDEGFCNEVGKSLMRADVSTGSDATCQWNTTKHECRATATDVVGPGSSECVKAQIPVDAFATYAEHLDFCSNFAAYGACLPAENLINYTEPSANTDAIAQPACRDWSEERLQCEEFTKKEACDYVDDNVFDARPVGDEAPDHFGRRCEWDAAGSACKTRLDACSQFNYTLTDSDYSSYVDECAKNIPSVSSALLLPGISCVPELQALASDSTRNTCQLEPTLTCESYIAQTELNCEEEDVLFARRTCSWTGDSCTDYVPSPCELATFESAPSDYKSFYDVCIGLEHPIGTICLPVSSTTTNQAGLESEVFGCDYFKPTEISCANFSLEATPDLSEDACAIADSEVYSYSKSGGDMGMFGLRCAFDADSPIGQCTDRTGDCLVVNTSQTGDLFELANLCKAESTEDELCWPRLEIHQTGEASVFNVCDLGRQDGADIHCSTPNLFLDDTECKATKGWFDLESDRFPELEYCSFVATDGGAQACKYDLPSLSTGCGTATFTTVPESYEEYFDLCSDKQIVPPYSQDKECIPLLTTLVDATADTVKCHAVFGPVKCETFTSSGKGSDEELEYCRAANRHIFTADVNGDMNHYGISCYPVPPAAGGTGVVCEELTGECQEVRYEHDENLFPSSPSLGSSTETPTDAQSYEWKAYNAECLTHNSTLITEAQTEGDTTEASSGPHVLPNYCMAEIMYVNEAAQYNTCSFVSSEELNCSLPRFQSQEACDTMKDMEITKLDATTDAPFKLGCTWVEGTGEEPGRCKSGMAKLLVPALMVLVSLLF